MLKGNCRVCNAVKEFVPRAGRICADCEAQRHRDKAKQQRDNGYPYSVEVTASTIKPFNCYELASWIRSQAKWRQVSMPFSCVVEEHGRLYRRTVTPTKLMRPDVWLKEVEA